MHDSTVCFERSHLGCHMELGPYSQGSMRIVKVPEDCRPPGEDSRSSFGRKVSRKVVSPLRCLTMRDMTSVGMTVRFNVW